MIGMFLKNWLINHYVYYFLKLEILPRQTNKEND